MPRKTRTTPPTLPAQTITVDMYICGQYVGERQIGINSVAGLLLRGNYLAAAEQTAEMVADIQHMTLPDRKTKFVYPAGPETETGDRTPPAD